jgi:acyl carrier protein
MNSDKRNKSKSGVPQLRAEIKRTIATIARIGEDQFSEDSDIRNELRIDSLRSLEILLTVEKRYGIKIKESKLFDVSTVGEFMDLVEEELSNQE